MRNPDLRNRKLFIPRMPSESAMAFAAAFRSVGVDATITPESDTKTLEIGAKYTHGDECLPQKVTMGDFFNVLNNGLAPHEVAFFMPTADGPCRFGQYAPLFDKTFRNLGYQDVMIISPTSITGYEELGEHGDEFIRTGWRALVAVELLSKLLHVTKPYEKKQGESKKTFTKHLNIICSILERMISQKTKLKQLVTALTCARDEFRIIPRIDRREVPVIGIVGEIFCRLNTFSNQNLVSEIEKQGGMVWMSDITEWVRYAMAERKYKLIHNGKKFSKAMFAFTIKNYFLEKDEHEMSAPLIDDLKIMKEPEKFYEMLELGEKYLPFGKVSGEMVVSIGRACYLQKHGVDGIIDISPFTCMNGIVAEAIYPKLSRDHSNIPIKTFYFDGIPLDLERDVGIFLELARNYKKKKITSLKS